MIYLWHLKGPGWVSYDLFVAPQRARAVSYDLCVAPQRAGVGKL